MKELVIISGKGGTGKTSIAASFAALAKKAVLADCDVDAADLHLILKPQINHRQDFYSGYTARIIPEKCTQCGLCEEYCRFGAIINSPQYSVDSISCEGCGVCAYFCPEDAIAMEQPKRGEWFISRTRYGLMVHARLGVAAENSGKLVTLVRMQAKMLAEAQTLDYIIIDGSPGVGCPVISSITGADMVLVVTEATVSGRHDLDRIARLTSHFKIPTVICVNKWDINPEITKDIQQDASQKGIKVVGKIRYDEAFTKAQVMGATVVEYTGGAVAGEIKSLWKNILYELG
ncbi:MAG: 4Fe-4S binding protein [candidate division Zixibacteria bacterium]|nr:4Fe-4S binding protein [Candidatus Tariuqbacter arcticus]